MRKETVYLIMVLIIVLVLASGCTTTPTAPDVVRVPVAVRCLQGVDVPSEPEVTPNNTLVNLDDRSFVIALARDRESLLGYLSEVRALLRACQ